MFFTFHGFGARPPSIAVCKGKKDGGSDGPKLSVALIDEGDQREKGQDDCGVEQTLDSGMFHV